MKKSILIVALALVIVGSMLAGTMAQYIKTGTVSGDVHAKNFEFTVNGQQSTTFNLKVAPGETAQYYFDVTNGNSETDMAVALTGSVGTLPKGLNLLFWNDEVNYFGNSSNINTGIPAFAHFTANDPDTQRWYLTADWTDGANASTDAEDTAAAGTTIPVTITLTATQD